jgi:predicted transposase YbfD/YdcC
MSTTASYPLLEALVKVNDFRKARGKRHPLAAILALGCAAALCGASSLTAMSQWGRHHGQELLARLGFTHFPGPSTATLCRIFSQLDVAALEQALTQWWQTWLPAHGGLALDGKTVRGSRQGSQEALQLLAAFATELRVVLAERAISDGDEIATALALLEGLDLSGWIVTGDTCTAPHAVRCKCAKLTQKKLVSTIVAQHGDYVLTAKDNQPTWVDDIATLFNDPKVVAETITTTRRIDLHGSRIEVRALQASHALTAEYCGWAGLHQVFRIERHRIDKRTGERTIKVHFGISSLSAPRADAKRLAAINRGHWGIENDLHGVRDVDFGEDASRMHQGKAPQVMAVFRNIAISLVSLLGYDSPIEGLRHFAWNSAEAVKLVISRPTLAALATLK